MKQQYTFSKIFSFLPFCLAAFVSLIASYAVGQYTGDVTVSTCGPATYLVPAGVECLEVQIWGAGGAGGTRPATESDDGAGGGGGGGYSFYIMSVTPGQTLNLSVGCGGLAPATFGDGGSGGASWFFDVGFEAAGGSGGGGGANAPTDEGLGGAGGVGNYFSGGSGGDGRDNGNGPGGGGGSSAGTGSDGDDGLNGDCGGCAIDGEGGTAPAGGGDGGNGGAGNGPNNGQNGSGPGGGGGGAGDGAIGGAGADGQIIITTVAPTICSDICMDPSPPTNSLIGQINGVTVEGLSNTGTGWNGYTDYSGLGCEPLTAGETYTFSIDIAHNNGNTSFTSIFIDWNGDGSFSSDESYDLGGSSSATTFTPDIQVPCSAVQRNIVMRVSTNYNAYPTGCSNSSIYGEIEDYCLTIVPETPPTSVAANDYAACDNVVNLDATATTGSTTGFWSVVSGSGTITNPDSQTTTYTDFTNGTSTLQWTATGECTTDTDQTTFIVSGLPDEPVSAGLDAYTCNDPFTLDGSAPAPFTGSWTILIDPAGPASGAFDDATVPNTDFTGMVNGQYTLEWSVDAGGCGTFTDQVEINFGGLPVADAGPDQNDGACPTNAILDAVLPAGLDGSWSVVSEPGGGAAGFIDDESPSTLVYGLLVDGTYQFQWTVSGGGCVGSTSAIVEIVIANCTYEVSHDPDNDQTFTGCDYTYTDDGGTGNYSANVDQTWTTFCPDDPDAYATLTLTSAFMGPYDYMVVYDQMAPAAPIVGGVWYDNQGGGSLVVEPGLNNTITSSTGCLYVQSFTSPSFEYSGWEGTIGCSSTAGTQTTDFVTTNNCGGGGGITVCESGDVDGATSNMDTNPPELGSQNQGCLGSQEGASNTWVYVNAESDGWISFGIDPAGGQDFDYAIWGPYPGGYACPGMTLDDPIRCTWAYNGGNGCDAFNGLSVVNTDGDAVLPGDVSEGGYCDAAVNEGWTYPIDANAGDVYVILFQNYSFNNSSFNFTINSDPTSIPGGDPDDFAELGCEDIFGLPIQLISFVGDHKRGKNYLYWNTASEHKNDYFIIEKSNDGQNWQVLTTVDGAGFSSSLRHYSTIDENPFDEVTYYRLVQVDFDGLKRSYKTLSLATEYELDGLFSYIYPNPSNGNVYFNYGGKNFNDQINIDVYNNLGQVVHSFDVREFNGTQGIEIDASDFRQGVYNVQIRQGDHVEVKRVSIVR